MTFQDLKLKFPGLSRTKLIFQDLLGLEILGENPELSRIFHEAGKKTYSTELVICITERNTLSNCVTLQLRSHCIRSTWRRVASRVVFAATFRSKPHEFV